MNRNSSCLGVVLRSRAMTENHKIITLLSKERGLVDAVAYGGSSSKSTLKHATLPFSSGTAFLYTQPNRKLSKLIDYHILNSREQLRTNIHYFIYASLWSECIICSHAANEYAQMYTLYQAALDALMGVSAPHTRLASARFVWRFLWLNGVAPSLQTCTYCANPLTGAAWYSRPQRGVLCNRCYHGDSTAVHATPHDTHEVLPLSQLAVRFFAHYMHQPFEEMLAKIDSQVGADLVPLAKEIEEFSYRILEQYIERTPKSLKVLRQL